MLCPKELATALGVSTSTARRLMKSGQIESCQIGKLWRTTPEHVETYKARQYERQARGATVGS